MTNLQLNLGAINPATGRPTQVAGDPEVLLATTFGRGDFAIRLAPDVFPTTVALDPTLPAPGGSDSGPVNGNAGMTNVVHPYIDGVSEISNFGNIVTITLIDEANGHGHRDRHDRRLRPVLDPGRRARRNDPSFVLDGDKIVGIQATDSSGAKGNVTTFTYTLKAPAAAPARRPETSDSGRSNTDNLTNITSPTFDVSTPSRHHAVSCSARPARRPFTMSTPSGRGQPGPVTDTGSVAPSRSSTASTTRRPGRPGGNPAPLERARSRRHIPPPPPPIARPGPTPGRPARSSPSPTRLRRHRASRRPAPLPLDRRRRRSWSGAAAASPGQDRRLHGRRVYLYQVAQRPAATSLLGPRSRSTPRPRRPRRWCSSRPTTPGRRRTPTSPTSDAPLQSAPARPASTIVIFAVTGTNYAQGVPSPTTTVAADGTYLAQVVSPLRRRHLHAWWPGPSTRPATSASAPRWSLTIKAHRAADRPDALDPRRPTTPASRGTASPPTTARGSSARPTRASPSPLYSPGQRPALRPPQAPTTSSTVNGSFQLQLPFNLTNGNTQLVAQATDIAGNKGPLSPALNLRIITVAGDYINAGAAQFTVFQPTTRPTTSGASGPSRSTPPPAATSRSSTTSTATARSTRSPTASTPPSTSGPLSNGAARRPASSAPAASRCRSPATTTARAPSIYGLYNPDTATWAVNLPTPGGRVVTFGVPNVDIPAPAAYDGGGVTEIAVFRPVTSSPATTPTRSTSWPRNLVDNYQVSFTDPAVPAKGFIYKAGDIPAPADYDGIGRDEFAIYRPTTGQFFILNAPNLFDKTTWTLRTVTLNLPGGPKRRRRSRSRRTTRAPARPARRSTARRTRRSTRSRRTNGIQQNIQFGAGRRRRRRGRPAALPALGPLRALRHDRRLPRRRDRHRRATSRRRRPRRRPSPPPRRRTARPRVLAVLPGSSTIALAMPTTVVAAAPDGPGPGRRRSRSPVTAPVDRPGRRPAAADPG